ncbi:ATPase, V1/A1 complex, subunit E [Cinara cedri]|uniref:ATPase, V1/A1 complex, subunit E n=1 Tax=Cinara cedri TaxID=506608 RepID=A0A5E4N9W3_9HEMI|nr:ATPase, V1/A1 complex, subunit E [Cinara cedri]
MNTDSKNIQVNKMIKFIDHDADEMKQGIDDLAEETFYAEKEKLISIGITEVDQLYNKQLKLINRETATIISTLITSAKLQILQSRDQHIKSVLADVNKELIKMRDKNCYKHILKNLILQAMYQILEEKVNFILILNDVPYVESMTQELENIYRTKTGKNIEIKIENSSNLPIQEIGGVIVTAKNRTIIVENTMVLRLLNIGQQAIPIIRSGLFGPNPTRTHLSFTL